MSTMLATDANSKMSKYYAHDLLIKHGGKESKDRL